MQRDLPRERFEQLGAEALTTAELIAVIFGSGMRGKPVLSLAHEVVRRFGGVQELSSATLSELMEIEGVGRAKAIQLQAAFALGKRSVRAEPRLNIKVAHPLQAYEVVKEELTGKKQELILAILRDAKGHLIQTVLISLGSLAEAIIHPREVFYPAIRHRAKSLILAHNHPSGDLTPSIADIDVTRQLIRVGQLMGIPLQDHLIVGVGYLSLRQHLPDIGWI